MTRRILIELALFLTPFAIFFFYRLASRELRVRDRWPLTMLVGVGGALAAIALIVGPLLTPSDKGKCYQAARYENGVTVPAKMVACADVSTPGHGDGSPTETAPVAPRDQPSPDLPVKPSETPAPAPPEDPGDLPTQPMPDKPPQNTL